MQKEHINRIRYTIFFFIPCGFARLGFCFQWKKRVRPTHLLSSAKRDARLRESD